MRPQLHKLPLISETSFLYNNWNCAYFDKPWHFHEEYELVTIDKSSGTKFIGDKVGEFHEGELMLIGPRVPHFFKNNAEYYRKNGKREACSTFIHFTEDFLGRNFFEIPEMKLVHRLLDNSRLALEIRGNVRGYIIDKLHNMSSESAPHRLVSLLDILIKLSESDEVVPLLSSDFNVGRHREASNIKDRSRIKTIFEYIRSNFNREIYVEEIAGLVHMSNAAFSRYFRHHTRKRFSDYVTEIRISHACKLLMTDDLSISQISFDSGFENLSNFYKHFRKIAGMNPKEYRKRFLGAGTTPFAMA
ncbi:AraC family transcriptional regulator [Foetidibacter luteolus]|uniref:AraC family transcriptional regulator n=1 Tax=Foetidibacter luteolus TaxID=2608880 RepID=UPI00129A8022|nr:AraC family transcriptional regulator [Foetidibacter luteolus]